MVRKEEEEEEEEEEEGEGEGEEEEQKGMFLYGIKCILMSRVIGMEISSSLF